MNARHFLLIAIALTGHLAQAADPHPKPAAAKPRLVPRAVPGLARSLAAAAAETSSAAASRAAVNFSPVPVVTPANQARIVAIYRRGTFSVPAATPATPEAPSTPKVDAAQPALPAPPKPGQVRILTPAEARRLTAQPPP